MLGVIVCLLTQNVAFHIATNTASIFVKVAVNVRNARKPCNFFAWNLNGSSDSRVS